MLRFLYLKNEYQLRNLWFVVVYKSYIMKIILYLAKFNKNIERQMITPMNRNRGNRDMERVKAYIWEEFKQDLSCFQDEFLSKTLEKRMVETGVRNVGAYLERLNGDPGEGEKFLDALFVFYSEFFREPFAFWSLAKRIIPEIIGRKKSKREIRIWSVGCSFGQEPYSIAMAANEIIRQSGEAIKVRIFASDLSDQALDYGRKGCYQRSDLKQLNLEYLDRYFLKTEEGYRVSSEIKEMVTFLKYDILDADTICPVESIFGGFDIIFCRNLLIYYKPVCQKIILNKLHLSLTPGGYLITGEAEAGMVEKFLRHQPLALTGAVFHNEQKHSWEGSR